MTTLPKSEIVDVILECLATEVIRARLHISETTDIRKRLLDFPRRVLLDLVLSSGEAAKAVLANRQDNFPLKAAPTLYLINMLGRPPLEQLERRIQHEVDQDRAGGLLLPDDRPVRIVYIRRGVRPVTAGTPRVFEVVFSYERRIDYTDADPASASYGEPQTVWTLENALLWYPEQDVDGAVLSCNDPAAVRPVLLYLRKRLRLECSLPDLSETMYRKIVQGSRPRSATFSASGDTHGALDVTTVTLYDTELSESAAYRALARDVGRRQTAGYFTGHNDLLTGGLGVTRRYGRVWTPRHLDRLELSRLAIGILTRTHEELALLRQGNTQAFLDVYTHHPFSIGGIEVTGAARRTVTSLLNLILRAHQANGRVAASALIPELLTHAAALKLEIGLLYDCPHCGSRHALCPSCGSNLVPAGGPLTVVCPSCRNPGQANEDFVCDCGESVPILNLTSHVVICPSDDLLSGLERYLALIRHNGTTPFIITAGELALFNTPRPTGLVAPVLHLRNLHLWRIRAHIHVHTIRRPTPLFPLLGSTKEKCNRGGTPPTKARCEACKDETLTKRQLRAGDLCLNRVFGLPLQSHFDGVHHRYEGADIKYEDQIAGRQVNVGIHVKSKSSSNPPTGLGRSNRRVKELYTQLYYSLCEIARGHLNFTVLGVAIPNRLSADVVQSMASVVERFGVQLLVIDHEDWLKVFDLANAELA